MYDVMSRVSMATRSSTKPTLAMPLMQEWQEHPDVLYATPLAMPGQKVVGPQDGMPTWVCELMVVKPTVEEAIEFVTAIEKSLQVPIE